MHKVVLAQNLSRLVDFQKSFLGLRPWAGWRLGCRLGSKGRRAVRSDLPNRTGCPAPVPTETWISSSPFPPCIKHAVNCTGNYSLFFEPKNVLDV